MRALFEKGKQSPLARNTLWMFLGQGARIPIQAIYFILIARSLGPNGYGAFVGVTALVAILAPFASLGSGNILIKNVARDETCFSRYWGKALILIAVSGTFLVLIVAVLSRVLLPSSIPFMLVLAVALADLIFSRALDVSGQAFQAFNRLARTSQLMALPVVIRLFSLFALLAITRAPTPVLWGYFYLLGILVSALTGVLLVSKELGKPVLNSGSFFTEMKEGFYFSISLASQNIYNDIDKTMLAKLSTLEAAGIYGAAYRIIDVSFTPIRSLLYASYARFFKSGVNGLRGTVSFAIQLLPYALIYGLAAALVLFVSAPFLPNLLGSEYMETVDALRWLALLPLLKALHSFAADSLTGAGFQGLRSCCQLTAAFLNVALILWLIPVYSWKGAAWASVATDSFLVIAMWTLILWLRKSNVLKANVSAVQ